MFHMLFFCSCSCDHLISTSQITRLIIKHPSSTPGHYSITTPGDQSKENENSRTPLLLWDFMFNLTHRKK